MLAALGARLNTLLDILAPDGKATASGQRCATCGQHLDRGDLCAGVDPFKTADLYAVASGCAACARERRDRTALAAG